MMDTKAFGQELKKQGFDFFSGVPCSFLKPLINFAINECEYMKAVNEGEAVSIAAGASVGGKRSVVLMQNSGLTNASSPLTSLIFPFKIPILGFVSLRGEPGIPDEPQHELMGQITGQMLSLMKLEWEYLSTDLESAVKQIEKAVTFIQRDQPFFFIVKKDTFTAVPLENQTLNKTRNLICGKKMREDQFPTRLNTLGLIHSLKDDDTVLLATTGKTGRELYEIEDAPNHFYMVGSMGCISAFALGLSVVKGNKNIIAIDGDGALLMRMGSLATNGYYSPSNVLHILLDNHIHDSTGGQSTVSMNVKFVEIAANCGYKNAFYVHSLEELRKRIQDWKKDKQHTFLYLKIAKGSMKNLGRPKQKPVEVKERLKVFLDD
ncbi:MULTISPECIES: phosphonopyruvate decarboxylase [unclassified Bacillus (in: firmicutes)]|uniref:phosphonopyruvate decarboxylase n=1 Tax=unclassified Bacillus (in: firmicutes) TaxID=185979 RepID=UPI0008E37492|nr:MULTISPECIES: phosphonopyruvate decarboxylase [unclassified Bacillus (in: firmicutes)]SFA77877.1 phosphonopyruvate decarboxylase [Bacillus sp. UNCCL13]SFQ67762.1 phosphonopyruvate decarboxylase [Bacillus sp. cl95]